MLDQLWRIITQQRRRGEARTRNWGRVRFSRSATQAHHTHLERCVRDAPAYRKHRRLLPVLVHTHLARGGSVMLQPTGGIADFFRCSYPPRERWVRDASAYRRHRRLLPLFIPTSRARWVCARIRTQDPQKPIVTVVAVISWRELGFGETARAWPRLLAEAPRHRATARTYVPSQREVFESCLGKPG